MLNLIIGKNRKSKIVQQFLDSEGKFLVIDTCCNNQLICKKSSFHYIVNKDYKVIHEIMDIHKDEHFDKVILIFNCKFHEINDIKKEIENYKYEFLLTVQTDINDIVLADE